MHWEIPKKQSFWKFAEQLLEIFKIILKVADFSPINFYNERTPPNQFSWKFRETFDKTLAQWLFYQKYTHTLYVFLRSF